MSPNPQLEVATVAEMVCKAARQAALDGVGAALSVAAGGTMDAPDRARDVANQVLSRAVVMQFETNRFIKKVRDRRRS